MQEGDGVDIARVRTWSIAASPPTRRTVAVPVLLGNARQLGGGALSGQTLRPPLIGASVVHRNSHANELLDIAQEGDLLSVA